MPRKRDFREEYRRRIARGLARGLSRSQARGHPKADERSIETTPPHADDKINAAILKMHHGQSLSVSARSSHVSRERVRRFIAHEELAKLSGRRWVMTDDRPRRLLVTTGGRQRILLHGKNRHPRTVVHKKRHPFFGNPHQMLLKKCTDLRQLKAEIGPGGHSENEIPGALAATRR